MLRACRLDGGVLGLAMSLHQACRCASRFTAASISGMRRSLIPLSSPLMSAAMRVCCSSDCIASPIPFFLARADSVRMDDDEAPRRAPQARLDAIARGEADVAVGRTLGFADVLREFDAEDARLEGQRPGMNEHPSRLGLRGWPPGSPRRKGGSR